MSWWRNYRGTHMEDLKQRQNRALALAGVVQAAAMAKQLAWKGTTNQDEFATAIYSIFQTHAPTAPAVYGEGRKVLTGLNTLKKLLGEGKGPKDVEIARYTMALIILERMLLKNPKMLNILQRGIDRARAQALHFSNTHENVVANLAGVYTDTISTFKYRIHVNGDPTYLAQNGTVNKIRTVLLSGIRSAVLWRQMGGSRWQLAFGKKTILQDVQALLDEYATHETLA